LKNADAVDSETSAARAEFVVPDRRCVQRAAVCVSVVQGQRCDELLTSFATLRTALLDDRRNQGRWSGWCRFIASRAAFTSATKRTKSPQVFLPAGVVAARAVR
jgi:hypothetical protein